MFGITEIKYSQDSRRDSGSVFKSLYGEHTA